MPKRLTTIPGIVLALASLTAAAAGQRAGWGDLTPGRETVGFTLATVFDHSRVFHGDPAFRGLPEGAETARPIRLYMWYPARNDSGRPPLRLGDYVRMAAEDFEQVSPGAGPAQASMPLPVQLARGLTAERRAELFAEPTAAIGDAEPRTGPFPMIVLGQGLYYESPLSLCALAEHLAARGYVVATCPLLGTFSRLVHLTAADLETEVRDLEFVIAQARLRPFVDKDRIGLAGYDLGGMAGLLLAMRNPWIRAMATLDAGILHPHPSGLPGSSPHYREDRFTIPWLMMTQDAFAAGPGNEPTLFDRKAAGDSYLLLFDTRNHGDFSSYALLGLGEIPRFRGWGPVGEKSPRVAAAAIRSVASFFDGYLRGDEAALEPLRRIGRRPDSPDGLIEVRFKAGGEAPISQDEYLHDIIARGAAAALPRLRRDMAAGRVHIRESAVDWLGLHFLHWWGREAEAVEVFRLMAELYPRSAAAHDHLGEALLAVGESDQALASYRRSLELDPSNANAARMIRRLEEKKSGDRRTR